MPNWCDNRVIITGKEEHLNAILEAKLSFDKLRPRPEEQEENWYEWNYEHWGTKWDIHEDQIDISLFTDEKGVSEINADFFTAWAPPCAFFKYLTQQMPGLQIKTKYYDGGMDICGDVIYADGKMFSSEMDDDEKTQFIREHFYEDYGQDEDDEDDEDDDEDDDECDIKTLDQKNI